MEFRDLYYFVAICEQKSFTKAAETLHITQPSLTMSINRLEENLNVQLLERRKRKKVVELTDAGKFLYDKSKALLSEIDLIENEIHQFGSISVKLGIPQILGAYFFPRILSGFMKSHPDFSFDIIELDNTSIVEELTKGSIDLGIITALNKSQYKSLSMKKIGSDKLCLCTSLDHPLAKRKVVSIEELKYEKFILFGKNSTHYELSKALFAKNNISPEIFLISDKIQTIKYMVASGIGVSLIMEMALKTTRDELSIIHLDDPDAWLDAFICNKKSKEFTQNVATMHEYIASYNKKK